MPQKVSASAHLVLRKDRRSSFPSIVVDRVTKNRPALADDEIAIKVNITVPTTIFEKLVPNVNVDIKEEHVITQDVTADLDEANG